MLTTWMNCKVDITYGKAVCERCYCYCRQEKLHTYCIRWKSSCKYPKFDKLKFWSGLASRKSSRIFQMWCDVFGRTCACGSHSWWWLWTMGSHHCWDLKDTWRKISNTLWQRSLLTISWPLDILKWRFTGLCITCADKLKVWTPCKFFKRTKWRYTNVELLCWVNYW